MIRVLLGFVDWKRSQRPPYRRFQQALISRQLPRSALNDMDGGPTIRLKPTQRPMRCAPEGQYMRYKESGQRDKRYQLQNLPLEDNESLLLLSGFHWTTIRRARNNASDKAGRKKDSPSLGTCPGSLAQPLRRQRACFPGVGLCH